MLVPRATSRTLCLTTRQPALGLQFRRPPRATLVGSTTHLDPARSGDESSGLQHSSAPMSTDNVDPVAKAADKVPSASDGDQSSRAKRFSILGALFLSITYTVAFAFFIPVVLAHPFVLMLDRSRRRIHDYFGMWWLKLSLLSVRIIPEVINANLLPKAHTPCVYVANHSSNMDVFALSFLNRPVKCVVKSEVFRMPIIGWAIRMAGNIGIDRSVRRDQMAGFRKMVSALRNGIPLIVYPEGTRSDTGRLRRFKAGAFRAAKEAGVPIVPITISGTREMMPSYAYVPLRYPQKRFRLTVHPRIESIGKTVEELRDLAFHAIDSKLDPQLQSARAT